MFKMPSPTYILSLPEEGGEPLSISSPSLWEGEEKGGGGIMLTSFLFFYKTKTLFKRRVPPF